MPIAPVLEIALIGFDGGQAAAIELPHPLPDVVTYRERCFVRHFSTREYREATVQAA